MRRAWVYIGMERETVEIIKHLEKCTASGVWQSDVFDDFLDMALASLEALPAHLKSARETGQFAEDTAETRKLWERLRARYKTPWYWEHFQKAMRALLDSTVSGYADVIGEVYMEFGIPNKRSGQFFTPFPIARMAAQQVVGMSEIYQILTDAYAQSPYGIMQIMLYGEQPEEQKRARLLTFVKSLGEDIVPLCSEHIRPLTVNDPACGSGVMFLAAAECFEPWVHKWGLVQFYGQDIDQTCVKMARLNMMIYGLNGYQIKLALALTGEELKALPQPYRVSCQEAQQAEQAGNLVRVDEIANELRSWKQPVLL